VPVISKHVPWVDSSEPSSSAQEQPNPWLSFEAIPLPKDVKKNLKKKSNAALLDYGPNSIRVIIISPTAKRARELERKCRKLVPSPEKPGKNATLPKPRMSDDEVVHVVCLTHSEPNQAEREAVVLRKSHILITTPYPLLDHLINTKGFQRGLTRLKCIVFDRADEFPHPDWLPALRDTLLKEDSGNQQWVATARRKTKTLDTIADFFLSDAGYSSVTV